MGQWLCLAPAVEASLPITQKPPNTRVSEGFCLPHLGESENTPAKRYLPRNVREPRSECNPLGLGLRACSVELRSLLFWDAIGRVVQAVAEEFRQRHVVGVYIRP